MAILRRLLIVAVAVVLPAAACSVDVDDDSSSGSDSTEASEGEGNKDSEVDSRQFATTAANPVTDDTIKLGAAVIDVEEVKEQLGVDLGELPDEVIPALVEAQNEDGGINGREIELVERRFLPIGTEGSEEVCRQLIEDDEVFAVIGTFLDDNPLCVTETYETPYFGAFGLTAERQERSKAPYITVDGRVDDDLSTGVDMLIADGELEDSTVAIYFEGDLESDWVKENITERLEDAGIEVTGQAQLPSSGDQVQADADATRILQRFEADGADTILNLSGIPVLVPALEKQSYRPTLIFTNGQIVQNSDLNELHDEDPTVMADSYAVVANSTSDDVAEDPLFGECVDTINERTDLEITEDDVYPPDERPESRDMAQLPSICQIWKLTVAVLEEAGDDPSPQSIVDGLRDTDLEIPTAPDAELSETRWGAGQPVRYWHWNDDTGFFDADPLE